MTPTGPRDGSTLIVMDVDGVVSPIPGPTAWGDDVRAGQLMGDVHVSPRMIAELEHLASLPGVTCAWLTSWHPEDRNRMNPFPGRLWPAIAELDLDSASGPPGDPDTWWKWHALRRWLTNELNPPATLVWCDDHLATPRDILGQRASPRIQTYQPWLTTRGYRSLLIAPDTTRGLTPGHLRQIHAHLVGPRLYP